MVIGKELQWYFQNMVLGGESRWEKIKGGSRTGLESKVRWSNRLRTRIWLDREELARKKVEKKETVRK